MGPVQSITLVERIPKEALAVVVRDKRVKGLENLLHGVAVKAEDLGTGEISESRIDVGEVETFLEEVEDGRDAVLHRHRGPVDGKGGVAVADYAEQLLQADL
jgi:hypothetical protein